ncbi:thiamine biosynthesis protein ThiJ [Variovorax sp. 553]|nr:thiamine biosynthesis protein ThiJ [Variovorax sp. 553]RSZ45015.1 thiamine biosynthesis protein ThiJ [Variovorax sp. 679]
MDSAMSRSTPVSRTQANEAGADGPTFVDALRPNRRIPVVAVLALNGGTETTDFLVPYAVLRRAAVAELEAVAPRQGKVTLMPALEIDLKTDIESFDRRHPQGADYVIVPAMHVDDDPAVLAWLRAQAGKGAKIIGICSGALVLGKAGLLDGRRFAGHWYDRRELLERYPTASYVPDRRYVVDRDVATTTGVSASLPAALALVEAIGGNDRATALAQELDANAWGPEHDSARFKLDAGGIWTYVVNAVAFWRRDAMEIRVREGIDDIKLAFAADAWSRTGRASVTAVSDSGGPVRTSAGLILKTVSASALKATVHPLSLSDSVSPAAQLDRSLCDIQRRYGSWMRAWVALQMEYQINERACEPSSPSLPHE